MRRSHWISLLVIVGIALVSLAFTVGTHKTPKLGLDLRRERATRGRDGPP